MTPPPYPRLHNALTLAPTAIYSPSDGLPGHHPRFSEAASRVWREFGAGFLSPAVEVFFTTPGRRVTLDAVYTVRLTPVLHGLAGGATSRSPRPFWVHTGTHVRAHGLASTTRASSVSLPLPTRVPQCGRISPQIDLFFSLRGLLKEAFVSCLYSRYALLCVFMSRVLRGGVRFLFWG